MSRRSLEEQHAWDEAAALRASEMEDGCGSPEELHQEAALLEAAARIARGRAAEAIKHLKDIRAVSKAGYEALAAEDWEKAYKAFEEAASRHPAAPEHILSNIEALEVRSSGFRERLAALDGGCPRKRIYIAGCGRSGTWLMAALMQVFAGVHVHAHEAPVGRFLRLESSAPVHVVKRHWTAWQTLDVIPPEIELLYLVRHPFDVFCSRHTEHEHYISAERWECEVAGLKRALSARPVFIVRYEDLVRRPQAALSVLAAEFGLDWTGDLNQWTRSAALTASAVAAMNGLRAIDPARAEAWRQRPDEFSYLRSVVPLIPSLHWFAAKFGYGDPAAELAQLAGMPSAVPSAAV